MSLTPDEQAEIDALKAEVRALREVLAKVAVAQVQSVVALGEIRTRLFDPVQAPYTRDPAPDLEAAFQNATNAAEEALRK